jgi:hypothetical protein
MELHMHSHRLEHRVPDWPAAAVSGFVGGAILMVVELLWSTLVMGTSPWSTSHKIAAIVMGPGVLQTNEFNITIVAVALVTHYVLGAILGMILGAIVAPFHLDSSIGMMLAAGAVFGLAIYLINFYGMVRMFPWFVDLRGWATLVAHLIFGMSTAAMYWQLQRSDIEVRQ